MPVRHRISRRAVLSGGLILAATVTGLAAGRSVAAAAPAADGYAIIFNSTKNDGGFNESALDGLRRFTSETGIDVRQQVTRSAAESVATLRAYAGLSINNILALGFMNMAPLAEVAPDFPAVHFTLIDGRVDLPNVRSVLFQEDEAAYLAGVAAALSSRTGTIGFVGAVPIPPIRRFDCGFIQGARAVRPDITVLRRYLGNEITVFRDRTLGVGAGRDLVARNADVVFAAAGFAGIGTLDAVTEAGRLGIGVDINQNGLHPGHILTSVVKRVDVAVYTAFQDAAQGRWTAGVRQLTLADQGIGWVRDGDNEALVAPIAGQIDAAAAAIAAGRITIGDFATTPACALP